MCLYAGSQSWSNQLLGGRCFTAVNAKVRCVFSVHVLHSLLCSVPLLLNAHAFENAPVPRTIGLLLRVQVRWMHPWKARVRLHVKCAAVHSPLKLWDNGEEVFAFCCVVSRRLPRAHEFSLCRSLISPPPFCCFLRTHEQVP